VLALFGFSHVCLIGTKWGGAGSWEIRDGLWGEYETRAREGIIELR